LKFSQTPFEVSNIPEHFHYSQHFQNFHNFKNFQNFPTLLPVLNMSVIMTPEQLAQMRAFMAGMTAEQLTALSAEAKKQKKDAKNEKQLAEEKKQKVLVDKWESLAFPNEVEKLGNDEKLRLLCAHYGLKVAHKRNAGRHQDRTLGSKSNRPDGQYSNIVANSEERFKYEIMGKTWRGAKIWEGKGKAKKCVGVEFDLQKAFKPIWSGMSKTEKKHWHHKFITEWWKTGDVAEDVEDPTPRTNSGAFIQWWNKHITRDDEGRAVFTGEYDVEEDYATYYQLAISGGGSKIDTPKKAKKSKASKTAPAHSAKKAKKVKPVITDEELTSQHALTEAQWSAKGRAIAESVNKVKKPVKKPRKRRTKAEMAEAKAMEQEDVNALKIHELHNILTGDSDSDSDSDTE